MSGDCVEIGTVCPDLPPDASVIQTIGQTLQDISQSDFDFWAIMKDAADCHRNYRTNPNTIPFEPSNIINGGKDGVYCMGLLPQSTFRFQSVEQKGFSRYVADLCIQQHRNDTVTNACMCYWYDHTAVSYNPFVWSYLQSDIPGKFLNFFREVQFFAWIAVLQFPPFVYVAQGWAAFWEMAGRGQFPRWFVFALGNLGLDDVEFWQRVLCFFLFLGSYFFVVFYLILLWAIVSCAFVFGELYDKVVQMGTARSKSRQRGRGKHGKAE
jgi:hypothetical protein